MKDNNVINFADYVNRRNNVEVDPEKRIAKALQELKEGRVSPIAPFPGIEKAWTEEEKKALDEALMEAFPHWKPKK